MQKPNRLATLTVTILVLALLTGGPVIADPASVTISGPTQVWVGLDQCTTVTWTASTNFTPTAIEWTLNGTVVGSGSTFSRRYCSPGLSQITSEDASVSVVAWITSEAYVTDSRNTAIFFDGGCFPFVLCS